MFSKGKFLMLVSMFSQDLVILQKDFEPIYCATKKIDGNAFQIDPPSPLSKETDTSTAFNIS